MKEEKKEIQKGEKEKKKEATQDCERTQDTDKPNGKEEDISRIPECNSGKKGIRKTETRAKNPEKQRNRRGEPKLTKY